jgi:hypothetical protein
MEDYLEAVYQIVNHGAAVAVVSLTCIRMDEAIVLLNRGSFISPAILLTVPTSAFGTMVLSVGPSQKTIKKLLFRRLLNCVSGVETSPQGFLKVQHDLLLNIYKLRGNDALIAHGEARLL